LSRLRVGVVGVGHLGQHHARLLASIEGVELVGICDTNRSRADEIAAKFGSHSFASARELVSRVDAVTIAAPTVSHVDLALPFLEAGIATLVEKPIASSVEEAERLIDAAQRGRALLATGHTERFNPAVAAALPLIAEPRFIEIHRLATFPERSLDIDVIFDLMIHDFDLLLTVVKSELTSVEAVGVNVLTPKADIANARLRFASGCIANLTASRISRERVRKARFFQKDAYVSIDFAAQELEVYRLVQGGARPIIHGGKVDIPHEEPLRRELEDFVDAVRTGRLPGVTGRDGRDALALATRVAEKMESGFATEAQRTQL
jgi:predicted dehydrogenase